MKIKVTGTTQELRGFSMFLDKGGYSHMFKGNPDFDSSYGNEIIFNEARWRADYNGKYYYLTFDVCSEENCPVKVMETRDLFLREDYLRYESGNYFELDDKAKEARDTIQRFIDIYLRAI